MVGFRTATVWITALPAVIFIPVVTFMAIAKNQIKHPAVLLSDIHALKDPFYTAAFTGSWFALSIGMLVVFQAYGSVLRRRAAQVMAAKEDDDAADTGSADDKGNKHGGY